MPLTELLTLVGDGRLQVPDFQRPVILNDEWVRTLLASVSLGYPIGAVMLLPRTAGGYPFPVHPLPGASESSRIPDVLLVDGQHRVSALFQALTASDGVRLVGEERRRYAINIKAALEADVDRVAAIVPETGGGPSQFPLGRVFGEIAGVTPDAPIVGTTVIAEFERSVLSNFRTYRLPVILLDAATTFWTVRVRGGANGLELATRYRSMTREER